MHIIMKNVPVAKTVRTNPAPARKYPFADMKINEMFFVPGKKTASMTPYASAMGRKLGKRFTTRMCWMIETTKGWKLAEPGTKDAVLGTGVWRVE